MSILEGKLEKSNNINFSEIPLTRRKQHFYYLEQGSVSLAWVPKRNF